MLTRARKRKKQNSPEVATALVQLDGAEQTPPSSPPEPISPVSTPRRAAVLSPDGLASASLEAAGHVPFHTPPPPPLVPVPVVCRSCEKVKHSSRFFFCAGCHWESHSGPYLECIDCEELRLENIHLGSHNGHLIDCPECEKIRLIF